MKLVIGNKNYSTWSLRPWLLLEAFSVEFEEIQESLNGNDLTARLQKHSGTGRVPVLIDGEITIWDSLAICEYISENYLDGHGWPNDKNNKAIARAICAEMHSGFEALRSEMPMNCRAKRSLTVSDAAKYDIQRIDAIWSDYAEVDSNNDLRLFGEFSIADCFFAPVVMRFQTYDVELSDAARDYCQSMLKHSSLQKWVSSAIEETEVVAVDEAGVDR